MFALTRKKDQQLPSPSQGISGTYVKVSSNQRGVIASKYGQSYPHSLNNNAKLSPRGIPPLEISESYLTQQDEENLSKKSNKGSRRKLPFLQKRKKHSDLNNAREEKQSDDNIMGVNCNENDDENDSNDDDCISDITTYDEGIPIAFQGLNSNMNPVPLDIYKNTEKLENQYAEEAQIHERLNFIVGNYRSPPPYPGNATAENGGKSMIQQLLQERNNLQVRDNASMINYCQVDAPKGLSVEDLTNIVQAFPDEFREVKSTSSQFMNEKDKSFNNQSHEENVRKLPRADSLNSFSDDKLVMRTKNSPISTPTEKKMTPDPSSLGELHEKLNPYPKEMFQSAVITRPTAQMISEIYPRDYDIDLEDISQRNEQAILKNAEAHAMTAIPVADYPQAPSYMVHPERDYDLPINDEYAMPELSQDQHLVSHSSDHFRERSETFVPPSPYMQTEIPEWLVLYANASPEHDKYLKWEMFRMQELDCWQTMLKRLYMKELGQIVSWFEEYRQCMQVEIERRERELGINQLLFPSIDLRVTKTDV